MSEEKIIMVKVSLGGSTSVSVYKKERLMI